MTSFHDIFDGRNDIIGGENGRCIKHAEEDPESVLTDRQWFCLRSDLHLNGDGEPMGVYPMRPDGTARWGCIDVDAEDRILTQAVYAELWDLGVHPYVEVSRSKGYHVWWFYPEFIPGWIIRVLGLHVCDKLNVTLECNPKQFNLEDGKLGNYVRLPYPHGYLSNGRRVFIENGEFLSRQEFCEQVKFSHPAASRSSAISSPLCPVEYVLGVKLPSFPGGPRTARTGASAANQQAAFNVAFRGQQVKVGERDNQLFTAANVMWACGLSETEAMGRMTEVWMNQVEDRHTFPQSVALDKVRAVYRTRGRPHTRMMTVRAPIPVIV